MNSDLYEYSSQYSGYGLLSRLYFIAQNTSESDPSLSSQAYRLLHDLLKTGTGRERERERGIGGGLNTAMYIEIFAGKKLFEDFEYDPMWVEETDRRANVKLECLQAELQSAKSSMIKESIRVALNDLGDFYCERGNLNEAFKLYSKTRDYSSMPKHSDEYCINLVTVSIWMGNFVPILNYLGKADDTDTSSIVKEKLKFAKALYFLSQSNYEQAAKALLSLSNEINGQYSQIVSTSDIAIYMTLCGLATLNRSMIRKSLLENRQLKSLLDTVPLSRIMLNDYLEGKYSAVILKLKQFLSMLSNDIYFHSQLTQLANLIHNRLVITYLTPYSTVFLNDMIDIFHFTPQEIETILCNLITTQQIQGKIDMQTNTFQRTVSNQHHSREELLSSVGRLADECPIVIQRSIFRLQLMKYNIVVGSKNERDYSGSLSYTSNEEYTELMELSSF